MDPNVTAAIITGIFGILSTVVATFIAHKRGSRGKERVFEDLETELKLDRTTWRGEYQDVASDGSQVQSSGLIDFRQYGSRITGQAQSSDAGRVWIVEGIAYKGRLCYVYVDKNPNVTSIGTASFELSPTGEQLIGQWVGWSPDGGKFAPRSAILTKVRRD